MVVQVSEYEGLPTLEELMRWLEKLEEKVRAYREFRLKKLSEERARLESLTAPRSDLDTYLESVVGPKGRVHPCYGGFAIEVFKPEEFPWCVVILTLINNGFEVSFSRRGNTPVIIGKPSI